MGRPGELHQDVQRFTVLAVAKCHHDLRGSSLDEAATIDGCGRIRIFTSIILPLLGPAIAATIIFTFIWTFNDFFSQLIYLSTPTSETVPVALRRFVDATGGSSYGQLLAMSALSLVPTFVVFLVSQKQLVEGIATTGIRG